MVIAAVILGAFVLGLRARARLQRHFCVAFRLMTGVGLAALAFLAGWGFRGAGWNTVAITVVLVAQLCAVGAAAWRFRDDRDGPLLSFCLYGNPGFWSVPVTAAVFGPRAAVGIASYDLLTSPRLAVGLRFMRARAPRPQSGRTALVDYSPMAAASAGLLVGGVHPPPAVLPVAVVVLSTTLSAVGAVLLGLAWPRGGWLGAGPRRLVRRVLPVHLTVVPGLLLTAALAGVAVPDGAWVLALGPLPVASLSFARLYGYSPRLAACGLAMSMTLAAALLPLAAWLAHRLPG